MAIVTAMKVHLSILLAATAGMLVLGQGTMPRIVANDGNLFLVVEEGQDVGIVRAVPGEATDYSKASSLLGMSTLVSSLSSKLDALWTTATDGLGQTSRGVAELQDFQQKTQTYLDGPLNRTLSALASDTSTLRQATETDLSSLRSGLLAAGDERRAVSTLASQTSSFAATTSAAISSSVSSLASRMALVESQRMRRYSAFLSTNGTGDVFYRDPFGVNHLLLRSACNSTTTISNPARVARQGKLAYAFNGHTNFPTYYMDVTAPPNSVTSTACFAVGDEDDAISFWSFRTATDAGNGHNVIWGNDVTPTFQFAIVCDPPRLSNSTGCGNLPTFTGFKIFCVD